MLELAALKYLPVLATALATTVELSAYVVVLGLVLGVLLAALGHLGGRAVSGAIVAAGYVVRGVPLLVFVFAVYFAIPHSFDYDTKIVSAVVAMAVYKAAFVHEIFRGAIASVPRGLHDAAQALGMAPGLALRRMVLPVALRMAVAPLVNRTVMSIKGTSLASAIGVWELSLAGREIIQRDLQPFQVLGMIALAYFVLCYAVAWVGNLVERRVSYEH